MFVWRGQWGQIGHSRATASSAKRYRHIGNQALGAAADVLGQVKIEPASLKKSPKVAGGRKCLGALSPGKEWLLR